MLKMKIKILNKNAASNIKKSSITFQSQQGLETLFALENVWIGKHEIFVFGVYFFMFSIDGHDFVVVGIRQNLKKRGDFMTSTITQ